MLKLLNYIFFAVLMSMVNAWAQPAANRDTEGSAPNQFRLEVLDSAPDGVTVTDICCGRAFGTFTTLPDNKLSVPYGGGPIWLKVLPPGQSGVLALEVIADKVTLYRVGSDGTISSSVSGDMVSTANREMTGPKIAFEISQSDLQGELFLEVIQPFRVVIPIRFYSADEFSENSQRENIIHAIFIGGIIIMLLYNLSVSILTRDIVYSYNSITILSLLFFNFYMTGIGVIFVWPNYFFLSNYILIISLGSTVIFGSLFISGFLHIPKSTRTTGRQILRLFPPAVLVSLISVAVLPLWVVQISQIGLSIMLLLAIFSIISIRAFSGDIRAKILAVPSILCMLPGMIFVGMERVLSFEASAAAPHLLESVLFVEALFFSTVLAFRIRVTQNEINDSSRTLAQVQASKAADIIEAIDRERKRIASDLHDTAGQGMLAIANRLSQLAKTHDPKIDRQKEIRLSAEHSRGVIDELRRISHDLHPATLDYLGWHKAVESLFEQLREVEGIEVKLTLRLEEDTLNAGQQVHLYRIMQELVSNIAKHAGASYCEATIWQEDNIAKIELCDNGQSDRFDRKQGIGLAIVDQRVNILGGTWRFETEETRTDIYMNFPITLDTKITSGEYP